MSVESIQAATTIIGSLDTLEIINGGQDFKVGDILKLVHRDLYSKEVITNGVGAEVRVIDTFRGQGALTYYINNRGGGYLRKSDIFLYNKDDDLSGHDGSFKLGPTSYNKRVTYNHDLILDHLYKEDGSNLTLDSVSFNFSKDLTANISATLQSVLTFSTNTFGSIASLTEINAGNNYIRSPYIFVDTSMQSNAIAGVITYNTSSKIVSSSNTLLTTYFANDRPIFLIANTIIASETSEKIIVRQSPLEVNVVANSTGINTSSNTLLFEQANSKFTVNDMLKYVVPTDNTAITTLSNNTTYYVTFCNSSAMALSTSKSGTNVNITDSRTTDPGEVHKFLNYNKVLLYKEPQSNSTDSAIYEYCAPIFPANFAIYEPLMYRTDSTVNGLNANVSALPSNGNDIVYKVTAHNSGKGYLEGETVVGYLFNSLFEPVILQPGTGYTNNDPVVCAGGGASSQAEGFVITNNNGEIVDITLIYNGSGYTSIPLITVKSRTGSGAKLSASITGADNYNTYSSIRGRVIKNGIGVAPGRWTTTRGFLNSDKYIQDSNFYQDFSYQVRTGLVLSKYKDILYNTFHTAGSELFGQFTSVNIESAAPIAILQDIGSTSITSDSTLITVESINITSDQI